MKDCFGCCTVDLVCLSRFLFLHWLAMLPTHRTGDGCNLVAAVLFLAARAALECCTASLHEKWSKNVPAAQLLLGRGSCNKLLFYIAHPRDQSLLRQGLVAAARCFLGVGLCAALGCSVIVGELCTHTSINGMLNKAAAVLSWPSLSVSVCIAHAWTEAAELLNKAIALGTWCDQVFTGRGGSSRPSSFTFGTAAAAKVAPDSRGGQQ